MNSGLIDNYLIGTMIVESVKTNSMIFTGKINSSKSTLQAIMK